MKFSFVSDPFICDPSSRLDIQADVRENASKIVKNISKRTLKSKTGSDSKISRRDSSTFLKYIDKLHRQINPDLSISKVTKQAISDCIKMHIMDALAELAGDLCTRNNRKTMRDGDLKTAMKLILPKRLYNKARCRADKHKALFFRKR